MRSDKLRSYDRQRLGRNVVLDFWLGWAVSVLILLGLGVFVVAGAWLAQQVYP